MILRFETTTIHDIPVLLITPEGAAPRPVIFFIHGFGSAKAAGLNVGYQLARRGFCFMSMERDAVEWFTTHLA